MTEATTAEVHELHQEEAEIADVEVINILHISDTHGLHRSIDTTAWPDADIVIHTGDLTDCGFSKE